MKSSLTVFAVVCLVLTAGTAVVANAQTFDENSADITNKYMPFSLGKTLVFAQMDKATSKPNGKYAYWHCTGYDIVDGVKCLKVNATGWSLTTTGICAIHFMLFLFFIGMPSLLTAVYMCFSLQNSAIQCLSASVISSLWVKIFATLFMGSEAQVSSLANKTVTTNTGLGTFKGCLEVATEILGTLSFAPGIGSVKQIDRLGGISELAAFCVSAQTPNQSV